jgi:hypothetical protein
VPRGKPDVKAPVAGLDASVSSGYSVNILANRGSTVVSATRFGCVLPYCPPIELVGAGAKYYENLGVDFAISADQSNFIIPRSVCTLDILPSASSDFDLDMWFDSFLIVATAAAATESLELGLMCDTRRPPDREDRKRAC